MSNYVAAALIIGLGIGSASARDIGLGGRVGGIGVDGGVNGGAKGLSAGIGASVGGVGVGAGVSAGPQGVTAETGVDTGGVGGPTVGGSVSTGKASLGVGGNLGSAGLSTDTGDFSVAPAASGSTLASTAGFSSLQVTDLPVSLRPFTIDKGGARRVAEGYPFGPLASLTTTPGTPPEVVSACRTAVLSAAKALGAVRVFAASAGPLRQRLGVLAAPIQVRIDYARKRGLPNPAKVSCKLDAAGSVTAII